MTVPSGMIPPVVSPLTADRVVDTAAVGRLTEHVLTGGADAIFVLGSCGEGATLPDGVAFEIVEAYVGAVAGRVPVLAGVAGTSIERNVDLARRWQRAGADALVVMPPMYFNTTGNTPFLDNVRSVADAVSLPIVVYNIPHLTHHPISPDAVRALADLDQVVALKESSGDWETFSALRDAAHDAGKLVFQGAESLIARSLRSGADGAVPGIANVAPGLLARLVFAASTTGQDGEVDQLQGAVDALCRLYGHGFWLSSLKSALSTLGLAEATTGAALPPVSPAGAIAIREILDIESSSVTLRPASRR